MLWRNDVLAALQGGAVNRTVAELMEPDDFSVHIDESVYDVQRKMQTAARWAVPVTDHGQYRGIFTVDRFVHVYRFLNSQTPERRRIASLREQLVNAFRGVR
jgi:predicted transcriptional regulator